MGKAKRAHQRACDGHGHSSLPILLAFHLAKLVQLEPLYARYQAQYGDKLNTRAIFLQSYELTACFKSVRFRENLTLTPGSRGDKSEVRAGGLRLAQIKLFFDNA